jgi:regulator of sirC expression with transglutaminase-like and TPR domain
MSNTNPVMDKSDIWKEFVRIAESPDDQIDLARAALLIAATEYPELDIERQLGLIDSLATAASRRFGEARDPLFCINTLNEYLFDEVGFRGNQENYHDPRNSFLNEVLSRRLGIPITLSLICIEVGKRLDIPLIGIGMPGHFLIRHRDAEDLFIDPFYGGILLSAEECAQRLWEITRNSLHWNPRYLSPVSNREFIARMLRNLKGIYLEQPDYYRALAMIDLLVTLQPEVAYERRDRGLVHYQLGQYQEAFVDLRSYLESTRPGPDTATVERLVSHIKEILDN